MISLFEIKVYFLLVLTSRERPKSALYLRLKKRNVFEIVKGGLFETPFCCKKWKEKLKPGSFGALKYFLKIKIEKFERSYSGEKIERGTLWGFLTSIRLQIIKKFKGDIRRHRKDFEKKSHKAEKGANSQRC